ncbi:MFS transporter [Egicoccus halophilus]|uniref:MFS transporter n=1 Tax=Egicoccus halophilus TaxID=1670830 RepID=UPI001030263D|nr:MFS transporter [Egicoccus halophilus]
MYARLVADDGARDELPPAVARAVPANATRQVGGLALQGAGDLVVDPKTVLAWLLGAVGAPAVVAGLLVPVRESGSMLPQAALVPWLRRKAVRKRVWVAGELGQFVAVVAIAVLAATTTGAVAGWGVLAALGAFALARSVTSIASKDVMGRTVPAGQRGQLNGWASVASGGVAVTLGLGLRLLGDGGTTDATALAILIGGGAVTWLLAAGVFARIVEAPEPVEDADEAPGALATAVRLLRHDRPFRSFVVARTLLLVSALTPPFVVTLASRQGGGGLAGLGPFVLGSGIASLLGGRLWGRAADRSSRRVMVAAAVIATTATLAFLAALQVPTLRDTAWLYPAVYLVLALAHTGTRIGRKTYVVDLADGNRRTEYVAVSNAAMGLLLLATGALSSAVAGFGPAAALLLLSALGVAAVPAGLRLPEVSGERAARR